MSRLFESKWRGLCSCGYWWSPGEDIGYFNDDLVCEQCYDDLATEAEWKRYFESDSETRGKRADGAVTENDATL